MYQTLEQSQSGPIIYAFRDPFVFRNPEDGQTYALFEGNNGGEAGTTPATRTRSVTCRRITWFLRTRSTTPATSA